jgi:hypothetical protein
MTNIYNKTEFERNSIQDVPAGYIDNAANDLYRFLGSFWRNVHEGEAFLKGVSKVRGIKLAQFYLDLLESLRLQDRKNMPVFHRELWKPLIIRKSQQNKAQENVLKLGGDMVIGPQDAGSKYGEGTVLGIGSLAGLEGYVTYPVEEEIDTIVSGIANNVINPTVSYKVAHDFPSDDVVYMNGTLIFPVDKDPFAEGSGFETYDVGDIVEGKADQETVLWASNVLIDKDYVSDHMAYALGIDCKSSDVAKRILNAGWDSINCGLTPELFRTLVAALLNIPVIQESSETVSGIVEEGGVAKVVTDRHTYTMYANAKLRDCVKSGAELHRGDFLDQAVKVYPLLTDVSAEKLVGTTEYAEILKLDVPVVSMPRSILRTKTSNGLAVDWTPTPILWDGDLDANGNRKLYFKIGGPEEDVEAFWKDTWERAERENVNLDDLFAACEYTESSESSSSDADWQIIPAAFFLQNMLGANTLIVTLDRSQVEDVSLLREQMFFDIINKVMPSGMRLFFIEHVAVGDKRDTYSLEEPQEGGGEYAVGAVEQVDKYVLRDLSEDEYEYKDLPGIKGKKIPTYEDQVEIKFLRNRKRTAD